MMKRQVKDLFRYAVGPEGFAEITGYLGDRYAHRESTLTIPDMLDGHPVRGIAGEAFKNKWALEQVILPEGVVSIGEDAFSGCCRLTGVSLPRSLTVIGEGAFAGCDLGPVEIPDSVVSIGANAFQDCDDLIFTVHPGSRGWNYAMEQDISTGPYGNGNFQYCLRPDGAAEITGYSGREAAVMVPEALDGHPVERIRKHAFAECDALTSVTISEGVRAIDDYAFRSCTGLTVIRIPATVECVGIGAFLRCKALTDIRVSPENPSYHAEGGALYQTEQKLLMAYPSAAGEVVLPQGVGGIAMQAFGLCRELESIILPGGLASIGNYAFNFCESLKQVHIPEGLKYVGNFAFHHCSALEALELPDSVTQLCPDALCSCSALKGFRVPAGVERVYMDTFHACKDLKEITFPERVTEIMPEFISLFDTHPTFRVVPGSYVHEYALREGIPVVLREDRLFP